MTLTELHDDDFYAWTREAAERLRHGHVQPSEIEAIAEEIEDMGISQRRELWNRLRVLAIHLLKWRCQTEHRSRSWHATIQNQRDELTTLFKHSPSLRRLAPEALQDVYPQAVRTAALETTIDEARFSKICPWTVDEVLGGELEP